MTEVTMIMMVTVLLVAEEAAAAVKCSRSCLVEQDIISCRNFDHPADIRSCALRHPSASVLDLSYISIQRPLARSSLHGLSNIVVLYLDGSRIRRLDADALDGMDNLKLVFARRLKGSLRQLVDAVSAAPSVRQVTHVIGN